MHDICCDRYSDRVSRHCRSALNEHQCNNIYAMPCNIAIAASAPMRNAIAGNSVMSESNASIVPSSHNMWRSISTNLVMPVEFESMMLPCSDSWRSIAGNLKMPAEFANMLPSDSWRSIAGNLSMPSEFANMLPPSGNICLQCYGDLPSARTRGRATAPSASIVVTAAPSPDAPLAPIVAAADSSSAPTMCNIVRQLFVLHSRVRAHTL